MAIAEVGRTAEARDLAEYALSIEPRYGWAAHSRAHIAYEDNEPDGARPFLAAFLDATPREGVVWSHLAWHLAIAELHAGNHTRPDAVRGRRRAGGTHGLCAHQGL